MTGAAGLLISLKASVFHSRFSEGVVFRGTEAPVILRGEKAHKIVAPIIAEMDKGISSSDLLAKLPEPVTPIVAKLLNDLDANGLLRKREVEDFRAELELPARFAHLWQFLADHLTRPGTALRQWMEQTFYIEGDPLAMTCALRSLAETAGRNFVLAPHIEDDRWTNAIAEIKADFPAIEVEIASTPHPPAGANALFAGGDAPLDVGEMALADAWFFGLVSSHLVVGKIDGRLGSVIDGWSRRIHAPAHNVATARIPETRIRLSAACAAFGMLGDFLEIETGAAEGQWLFATGPALTISAISLPGSVTVGEWRGTAAEDEEPMSDEDRIERLGCLTEPVTGFLDQIEGVDQVPLSIVHMRVRVSGGHESDDTVVGWGETHQRAELDAIRNGIVAFLRHHDSIDPETDHIGVGWTPDAAAREAKGRAVLSLPVIAGADWEPFDLNLIDGAGSWRLAKLLALMTGTPVALERAYPAEGEIVAVRALQHDRPVATATGGDLEEATYSALGQASVVIQLDGKPPARAVDWSDAGPDTDTDRPGGAISLFAVDLGYPEIGDAVHCCIARVGT